MMKGFRTVLCFLGMMSISFAVSAQAAPVGTFTFLSGRVDMTSPGRTARPVQLYDEVGVGDIVRTKSQSRAEITFADGNILRLAQNTRVEITEYMVGQEETKGSLHLFRGKIQSVVKTGLGRIFGREKRNRYEVRTPTAVCGVRGTNFFTWHTKAGSGAAFKQGRGYAYSTGRPEDVRRIHAGQAMLVVSSFDPPLIRPATPFELEQHFDDTRPEKSAKANEPQPLGEETPVPVAGDEADRLIREPDPAGEAKTSLQKAEEETGRSDAEISVSESKKLAQTAEAISQSTPEPIPPEKPSQADEGLLEGKTFALTPGSSFEEGRTGGRAEFGSHPVFGGGSAPDTGMWLSSHLKDAVLQEGLLTAGFEGHFLSFTKFGEVHGDMLGTYDTEKETWQADVAGVWNATHRLEFNGLLEGELMGMVRKKCCTCLRETGWASGLMGGLSDIWSANRESPAETRFMGDYDQCLEQEAPPIFSMNLRSYNPYDDTATIWNQKDNTPNGAYYGFLAGRGLGEEKGEGAILALYLDREGNAGILKGGLGLEVYADMGMWQGRGTLFPLPLWDDTGYEAAALHPESLVRTGYWEGLMNGCGAFTRSSGDDTEHFGHISWTRHRKEVAALWKWDPCPSVLGVTSLLLGGTFDPGEEMDDGGPLGFTDWFTAFSLENQHGKNRGVLLGAPGAPGSWSDEMISGKGYQAWVNWDAALTGLSGAELKGTFDPNTYTCQAATLWAFMDTNTFVNLADTKAGQDRLAELNIPCVEVGQASLSGTDDVLNVTMHDVTFFAYSTGHDPRIWATNTVDGEYFKKPGINHTVPLNGGGLSAHFQVRKWESNRWGASITNGAGILNRTDGHDPVNLNFTGAAAGAYSKGSFSGTASGIAAPAPLALDKVD